MRVNLSVDPLTKFEICGNKLIDLENYILSLGENDRVNEYIQITLRLFHAQGRLSHIMTGNDI